MKKWNEKERLEWETSKENRIAAHEGAKLLSDADGVPWGAYFAANIKKQANIAAWKEVNSRENDGEEFYKEDVDFLIADIEARLLDCPIDGYHEISSIFIGTPEDASEMIDFLTDSRVLDEEYGSMWYDVPCDSAARELFWDLKTSEMEGERNWVIAYLQDKIDNNLF